MFWSGADFDEAKLSTGTGKCKDASICYTALNEVDASALIRWLEKAKKIQRDYKNLLREKEYWKKSKHLNNEKSPSTLSSFR